MRFMHFPIKASFTVDTKGWYCVGKRQHFFSFLLGFVSGARTSVSVSLQFVFQFVLVASVHHQPSSVLLNSKHFPQTFLTNRWGVASRKTVCWKVSVVFTSRIIFRLISCLCKQLCLKTLSQWVSVVNLIVGSCKFASSKKGTMCCLKTV